MLPPRRLPAPVLLATCTLLGSLGCRDNETPAPSRHTTVSVPTAVPVVAPVETSKVSEADLKRLADTGTDVETYEILRDILKGL